MSEAALWSMSRDRLRRYGVVRRIENSTEEGTPDVVYCLRPSPVRAAVSGWLELKHLPAWPARASTPVVIDHLTLEQVRFALAWSAAGGRVHALLQVRRTYLLLEPETVRAVYARQLTRHALMAEASVTAEGRYPTREIVSWLTQS